MRRIRTPAKVLPPIIALNVKGILRDSQSFIGHLLNDAGAEIGLSTCFRCADTPCIKQQTEMGNIYDLCPTNSISRNSESIEFTIDDSCVKCGLCIISCPVGFHGLAGPSPAQNSERLSISEVSAEEQVGWLNELEIKLLSSNKSPALVAKEICEGLRTEKAAVIYPLVAAYLRSLGFTSYASNMGDTSSRADVTIVTPVGLVPIEVKSYTEVPQINLHSIQQGLENKLLASRQDQIAEMNNLSSLVIGFDYPSDRTLIIELLADINKAFGVTIGLISLPRLVETAIKYKVLAEEFDMNDFLYLEGVY